MVLSPTDMGCRGSEVRIFSPRPLHFEQTPCARTAQCCDKGRFADSLPTDGGQIQPPQGKPSTSLRQIRCLSAMLRVRSSIDLDAPPHAARGQRCNSRPSVPIMASFLLVARRTIDETSRRRCMNAAHRGREGNLRNAPVAPEIVGCQACRRPHRGMRSRITRNPNR